MTGKKYGIVVCPNCQNAKAVDLSNKSSKCSHCGKKLEISRLKIYYEAESQEEISWAVGQLNAKMRNKEIPKKDEQENVDVYSLALKEGYIGSNQREKLLSMSRVLTKKLDSFGREDIKKLAERGDIGDVDDIIEKLRKIDEIYEPEFEVFKAV